MARGRARVTALPVPDRSALKRVAVGALVANPRNPRVHSEEQLERLAASIKRFGQTRPILVRTANSMIVAGHGVWMAAKRAGLEHVEILEWDVDQSVADSFMLADNKHPQLGRDVQERVKDLLREFGAADPMSLGFGAAEVADLLRDASDMIEVAEIQTGAVRDRFWISVRGPLAQQAKALKRIRDVMAELPEVEVEQGTTAYE